MVCDSRHVLLKALNAQAEKIDPYTYIVKISVVGFTHLPGQYVMIRCGKGPGRYFSVLSRKGPYSDNDPAVVELLIRFNEWLSASHKIILDILSGEEIYISEACGHAYWRRSDYGNVLIACDSGYSYVRGIAEYIAGNESKQPTLLISINETGHTPFDTPYLNTLIEKSADFRFMSIEEAYAGRNNSFITHVLQQIHEPHFSLSNFYIGSGRNFFQMLKDKLCLMGVNQQRIISDNH